MSTRTNETERVTASATVLAAAIAAAIVYVLSDLVVIERPVVVASAVALGVALVGVAVVLFVDSRR